MNDVFRQLDHVAERMKERTMIDPVEYGELKGAVTSLQLQVSEFKAKQGQMDVKLDMVLDRLAEAKGGWKVMLMFGGAAGTLGAGLSWVLAHLKG